MRNLQQQKFLGFRVYRFRDTDAFNALYRAEYKAVLRFLANKLPRPEDADDLASEVFLRAWEYMTANMVDHAAALFFKIAHNLVADFYRKKRLDQEPLTTELEERLPDPASLSRDIELREMQEEVLADMRELKEEYRQVLTLRHIDQLSIDEIAAALGKTANNVRVLLFRAKNAIKKQSKKP